MELHDFIATTLSEIQLGVQSAIKNSRDKGLSGVINPVWGTTDDVGKQHLQNVQFDVAVTVVDKTTGGAEGGIKVVGIGVGASGSSSTESSKVSRIQFSIPLVPPVTTVARSK